MRGKIMQLVMNQRKNNVVDYELDEAQFGER